MASPVRVATPPKHVKRVPESCPIGDLFRTLGESHVLDILYLTVQGSGPRRFVELQRELKMSANTLTDRLKGLVEAGLLTRRAYNEIPPRVEYEATPKARELGSLFQVLNDWAQRNSLKPVPVLVPSP